MGAAAPLFLAAEREQAQARGPGDLGRRGADEAGAHGVGQGRGVHGGGRQEHAVLVAVAIHETQGIVYLRAVSN